jgi:hypothetical protein
MIDSLNDELKELERQRVAEMRKAEALQDELNHRGTGHEIEVEMRLKFESKLNNMYAMQREMEGNLDVMHK